MQIFSTLSNPLYLNTNIQVLITFGSPINFDKSQFQSRGENNQTCLKCQVSMREIAKLEMPTTIFDYKN